MVAVLARYKNCFQCFPAHDELGMCKASLVSPEQPFPVHISMAD